VLSYTRRKAAPTGGSYNNYAASLGFHFIHLKICFSQRVFDREGGRQA